jgi:lipoprotein-anchoring transpeptidase ErfK/SrfK
VLTIAGHDLWAEDEQRQNRRVVISLPDRKLALLEGNGIVRVYDVAVGKLSTPSPQGQFSIVTRIPHPTWYGPEQVVPPGAANPLGTRWIGLSVKGYGIHGTNAPKSIGKAASHGCIRMRNRDVEELFDLVSTGVPVELHGERPEVFTRMQAAAGKIGSPVVQAARLTERRNHPCCS